MTFFWLTALLLSLAAGTSLGQNHRVIHHFAGPDGATPVSLVLSGGTLFGITDAGGISNRGTVFRINTDGTEFLVLKQFTGRDGAKPFGTLVLSDATLYGRTSEGGISNCGTIFKVNTDGSDYALLKEFTDSDKANAPRRLVLTGDALFGAAYNGGISNRGSICKLNTDGNGFAVIKDFTDPEQGGDGYFEGCLPGAALAASGPTLYGTTVMGGVSSEGGIFKINADGTGYTVLKQGSFADGGHFMSGVIVSGDTLYGASPWGGGGIGALFKVNTDGSGFSILRSCHPYEVHWASSLAVSGAWLCGVSQQSGISNNFVIFILRTDGSHFGLIKRFDDADGVPGGLVLTDTTLYGVTTKGGHSNSGTVFGLSVRPPAVTQPPQSRTAEPGANVNFPTQVEGAEPLAYGWVFNETTVLEGCTNALLRLTNIQPAQAGGYTLIVTNLFGAATSPPAMLQVIPPVERWPVAAFNLTGESGSVLTVDYATKLSTTPDWLMLDTVSLSGTSAVYVDVTTPLSPQRFYRVWQSGTPGVAPSLSYPFLVPALTLTGNPGDQIRVDGINQIGPTDAWFTLDTVTLTNASQLYFDMSAPGQPARLYRLMPVP